MSNPERILSTLDSRLDHEVPLVVYGRAAIALGFDNPPEEVKQTLDVDVIVGAAQTEKLRQDRSFWDGQEATNQVLAAEGLYLTHIFEAEQVFLRANWEQNLVAIKRPVTKWLRLFRPATLDLILTKMMRGDDAQDLQDIAFMIRHDGLSLEQIEAAFAAAVIPDLLELREAFEKAKPCVRELARSAGK